MEIKTSKEIRLLLVGKTGSGKSSVGNQLIGSKVFKVGRTCETRESQLARHNLEDGSELVVVDTPGYCNIHLTEDETEKEINRGMELLAPGPHCVIIVFSLSERITGDDIKRLQNLQSLFAMYLKHVLVVFTGLDHLEEEDQTRDQYIQRLPQQLHDFISRLEAPPLGVNTRHHTDINSSSQIIEAIKQTDEKLDHSFIESTIFRKRKGDKSWISVEEPKVAKRDEPFTDKRTVLLLGKSGVGKSSVGNVLLGEKKFSTSMFEENGTKTCQIEESDQLIVIDTPGFFSSINSDVDTANDIISTIKGRVTSIHVFILVLSVDTRFAGSEDKDLEFVRSLLGGEILDRLMYAFTRKDSLEDDEYFIYPQNLPHRPYRILNCKPNSQKDREDLLREIVSFNNPISSNKIGDANLDHIAMAERHRKEASQVDCEAYMKALDTSTRFGNERPKRYKDQICDWVSNRFSAWF